MTQLIRM